jgi:L-ascorbate metabolism protein UlaG (beta-lactamase superfamily)
MRLQLIRNATLILHYAGQRILIDPDLAARHARPSFTGRSANPMVDLPVSVEVIAADLTLILVSHLHRDHFDAVDALPHGVPVLCQPGDEARIAERGFTQVTPLGEASSWQGLSLQRTPGHHGLGAVEQPMGAVSGFVLRAPGEPTLYWAGDTLWCPEVLAVVSEARPDVIVTHSCGARWPDEDGVRQLIVMDAEQTIEACRAAPRATVVATHMEALDHATVTRAELRQRAEAAGIPVGRLQIPQDGEELMFAASDAT